MLFYALGTMLFDDLAIPITEDNTKQKLTIFFHKEYKELGRKQNFFFFKMTYHIWSALDNVYLKIMLLFL